MTSCAYLASLIALIGVAVSIAAPSDAADDPAPPSAQPATSPFDAQLEEIDSRIATIDRLRATFRQTKKTPLLKKPVVSSGVILVKGDRLRWDTTEPAPSTLTTDPEQIRIYYPEAGVVEEYETEGDIRLLSGTPLPRLATLRQHFTVSELNVSEFSPQRDSKRYIAAELLPKEGDLSKYVKVARVLLDREVPCVSTLILTDLDGEVTEIEFSEVQVGVDITDEQISLFVPPGTLVSRPLGEKSRDELLPQPRPEQ